MAKFKVSRPKPMNRNTVSRLKPYGKGGKITKRKSRSK